MKFTLGTMVPAPAELSERSEGVPAPAPAPLESPKRSEGAPDSKSSSSSLEKIQAQLAELNASINSLQEGALMLQIQQIHGALLNSPEITYLLSDEEIGVLFKALQKAKNSSLAEAKKPKKVSAKKELENAFSQLLDFQ